MDVFLRAGMVGVMDRKEGDLEGRKEEGEGEVVGV